MELHGAEYWPWCFPEQFLLMVPAATVIQTVGWLETSRSGVTQWANPVMPARSVTEWGTVIGRDTYPGWAIVMARNADMVRAMVTRVAISMGTRMDTRMENIAAVNTDASTVGAITNGTAVDF